MYIESVDLGEGLDGTELLTKTGVIFKDEGDVESVDSLIAQSDGLMHGIDFKYGSGMNTHFNIDKLQPSTASVLFSSEDDFPRMFYQGTENFRVVSSSVVLGGFQPGDSLTKKTYLMAEIVNYLLGIGIYTGVDHTAAGNDLSKVKAWPNPFTEKISFSLDLNQASEVTLRIFDDAGRLVNLLYNGNVPAGQHSFVWDGSSQSGVVLRNGIYFYNVMINAQTQTGKIILAK